MDKKYLYKAFKNNGGILRTYQLNELGFYSRQINKLIENNNIVKIKRAFYELTGKI